MKKLTDPQFKIILACLVQEMLGKVIYVGNNYGICKNKVYIAEGVEFNQDMKTIRPSLKHINRGMEQIGTPREGLSLKKTKVLSSYVYSPPFNEFKYAYKIGYSKLLAYSNGAECIRQAIEIAQDRLTDESS